jgi:hypothetical protein
MKESFYTVDDFNAVKKIDAHIHLNTAKPDFPNQAKEDNYQLISINTLIPDFVSNRQQREYILRQRENFPDDVNFLATFENDGINEDGWAEKQLEYLKDSFNKGARGIKVWKDIGMVIKNKKGTYIMIDDPVFDPIFNYLEKNEIPVLGHIGEPKNCWLPLEEMTVNNDRNYFKSHPEYHMFLHPECPSY